MLSLSLFIILYIYTYVETGYDSEHDFACGIRRLQCESQLSEVKRSGPKVSIGHENIQSDDAQNNNNLSNRVFLLYLSWTPFFWGVSQHYVYNLTNN